MIVLHLHFKTARTIVKVYYQVLVVPLNSVHAGVGHVVQEPVADVLERPGDLVTEGLRRLRLRRVREQHLRCGIDEGFPSFCLLLVVCIENSYKINTLQ
jgi:hypothetical protein